MIGSLLATVLPAFLPVAIDGAKGLLSKVTGIGMAEPRSVKDFIELERLKIDKLRALAELDRPAGEVSRWVANFRASFRYFAVAGIVLASLIYAFVPEAWQTETAASYLYQLGASATFFIIGDRVYLGLKGVK